MTASLLKTASAIVLASLAFAGNAAWGSAFAGLANLREEVVLIGAVVNGYVLDMNRFRDARSAQALLDEVIAIWSQRPAPIHQGARDGWFTMTQLVGSTIETFEVRPAGAGAEGRRTRWRKDGNGFVEAADWLEGILPAGSRLLDRVSHQDGGRKMTTVVAVTSDATRAASRVLVSALKKKGFISEPRGAPSFAPSFAHAGMVFFLARGSEDIAVTISEHAGRRAIVMHWGRATP